MRLGFEWFVAWRYLREQGRRSGIVPMVVGALLIVGAAVAFYRAAHIPPMDLFDEGRDWKRLYEMAGLGCLALGILVGVFGYLHWLQSIFTTISTYGVFLGTAALVIVLSVMNGFEVDLRGKILGSNAHVLVSREDGSFTEWREVMQKLQGIPGVVAYTPYVTSEIVVAANSNYSGAIIKGIDPRTVGSVTDLAKNLEDPRALDRLWPLTAEGKPVEGSAASAVVEPPEKKAAPDEDEIEVFGGDEADAGIVPGRPGEVLDLRDPLEDPRVLALDGVIVGRELARSLGLYPGQEVVVVSPLGQDTPTGQIPRLRHFRVAGSFYTGMYEYDTKSVYVTLPALQRFLSLGDEVDGIEIKVASYEHADQSAAAIAARLGPAYRVQDWKELNRNLFSALKLEKIAMFLVLTIIILVASFSIVSNLIMVVVEKAKEIAILKSMGAPDGGVMRVFMIEGLYIGALGTAFGLTVGVGTCWALGRFGLPLDPNVYYIDRLPVAMDPVAIALVAACGIAISFIATLYPSYVAARLRPVEGLRYE